MITITLLVSLIRQLFLGNNVSVVVGPDTKLLQDGICDSLGLVRLAVELERQYPPLRIQDQEITWDNFNSIRNILRFLRQKGFETGEG